MTILIYAAIYEGLGTGNLFRMSVLYNFLINKDDELKIDFAINDKNYKYLIPNIKTTDTFKKIYDVILIDDFKLSNNTINNLSAKSNKLIAFDTYNYNSKLCCVINLYNHFPERIKDFNGIIYQSPSYVILRNSILEAKNNYIATTLPNILITFGGEDPNGNTLKVLEKLDVSKNDITVIIGKINKYKQKIQKINNIKCILFTDVLENYLSNSDIVICGGGTTLLETIYIGTPVIAIPQNDFEEKFINYINRYIKIFKFSDINLLLKQINNKQFREKIFNEYRQFINGKGKEEIYKIIKQII